MFAHWVIEATTPNCMPKKQTLKGLATIFDGQENLSVSFQSKGKIHLNQNKTKQKQKTKHPPPKKKPKKTKQYKT